ncbi:MAG: hypothetical protein MN733_28445, partial [Nitrososphaera sp.]|nr:hypothetical protein [Nitrososphaera sp.]
MAFNSDLITQSQVPSLDKGALNMLERQRALWKLIMAEGNNDLAGTGSNTKQLAPITENFQDVAGVIGNDDAADEKRVYSAPQFLYRVRRILSSLHDDVVSVAHGNNAMNHSVADRQKIHKERIVAVANKQLFNSTTGGWDGLAVLDLSPTYTSGRGTTAVGNSSTIATISAGYTFYGPTDTDAAGAWTPHHLTATQDAWGNSGSTWFLNCLSVVENANSDIQERANIPQNEIVVVMRPSDRTLLKGRARTTLGRYDFAEESSRMAKLGFGGEIEFDGTLILADADCTASRAYAIVPSKLGIWSPAKELIATKMAYDANGSKTLINTRLLGNLIIYQPNAAAVIVTA